MKAINLIISLALLGLFSCKKEIIEPLSNPIDEPIPTIKVNSANKFLKNNLSARKQVFTFQPNTYFDVIGNDGTIIKIMPNSFKDGNGNNVTSTISFELIEVLSFNDMIKTGVTAQSPNDLFISGGQLKMTASSNGQEVYLKEGYPLDIYVPTVNLDPQMRIFEGAENNDSTVVWNQTALDTATVNLITDTINGTNPVSYYNFLYANPNLNWINCDYFYNSTNPKTFVTINLQGNQTIENTVVFIYFEQFNSVLTLHGEIVNGQHRFVIPPGYSGIPININASIFAISKIDEQFYYNKTDFLVSENYSTTIDLTEISEENLNLIIDGL